MDVFSVLTVHLQALLKKNAKVYIAGRSRTKAEEAIGKLRNEVNGRVDAHFLELDLGNLKSVKRAVGDYTNRESKLHILFNNGFVLFFALTLRFLTFSPRGVMHPPLESLTSDGYDDQFGINVLGHFYFTKLLLPILLATAAQPSPRPFSGPTCRVRVVNTSSIAHYNATGIDFSIVRGHSEKRNKVGIEALYGQSKLVSINTFVCVLKARLTELQANVIFAQELHKRYGDMGIVSTSLHPGQSLHVCYWHSSEPTHCSPRYRQIRTTKELWRVPEMLHGTFIIHCPIALIP